MVTKNGGTTWPRPRQSETACIKCGKELGVDAHPLRSYCKECYTRKRSFYMRKRYLEINPRPRKECVICKAVIPRNHSMYCTIKCTRIGQAKRQKVERAESDIRKRDSFGQTMVMRNWSLIIQNPGIVAGVIMKLQSLKKVSSVLFFVRTDTMLAGLMS